MRVAVIADGSSALGAGHQVRSGVLAQALAARGHTVELRCRDLPGSSHAWAWQGLPQRVLPADAPLAALGDDPSDALIVDHYGVRGDDLRGLRRQHRRILVIDDVPGGDLAGADLVLNQNLGVEAGDYAPLRALVGPDYALVRPPFLGRSRHGDDLLVMLGASDVAGLAGTVAAALRRAWPGRRIHVVAGRPPLPADVHIVERIDAAGLAALMAGCSAAVLAAGSSVYEALAMRLPFVAIHTMANQDRIVAGLRSAGLAPVIAPDGLGGLPALVAGLPTALPPTVDGRGAERIVGAMEALP